MVGDAFLDLNLRDSERVNEGIREPRREVRPSMGLKGTSSARRLLAQGFGANSVATGSSVRSYAVENSRPVGS